MADKYDPERVSPVTHKRLAVAFDANWGNDSPGALERYSELRAALDAFRAEATVKLRTRAEVDAEIARTVRVMRERHGTIPAIIPIGEQTELLGLCAEPTAEPPIDCEFPEADPCGCEAELALRERLRRCLLAAQALDRGEVSVKAAVLTIEKQAEDS